MEAVEGKRKLRNQVISKNESWRYNSVKIVGSGKVSSEKLAASLLVLKSPEPLPGSSLRGSFLFLSFPFPFPFLLFSFLISSRLFSLFSSLFSFFKYLLFIWKSCQGGKQFFHLLVHCPDGFDGREWTGTKPEARRWTCLRCKGRGNSLLSGHIHQHPGCGGSH